MQFVRYQEVDRTSVYKPYGMTGMVVRMLVKPYGMKGGLYEWKMKSYGMERWSYG